MVDILDRIKSHKLSEIMDAKVAMPLPALERAIEEQEAPRGFVHAILAQREAGQPALIAEIKKASPSKGLLCPHFDPISLAQAYEAGGATCLSVLTDSPFFQGSSQDLTRARKATKLPILRKDFLYDPYQVYEARAWGADCILIILSAVDDLTARLLNKTAHDLRMDVLVEVHDAQELARALALETRLIGINHRNLHNFKTDLTISEKLATQIPPDKVIVAESGISSYADCQRLMRSGIYTFLVGESLVGQADVGKAAYQLLHGVIPSQPELRRVYS